MTLYYIAAAIICLAAVFHSIKGEELLIKPTLAAKDAFIQRPMTQAITRFGWHSSSLYMLLTAILLVYPEVPEFIKFLTGVLWLVLGAANLIMTKAKHPGGALLSIIGIIILIGYFL